MSLHRPPEELDRASWRVLLVLHHEPHRNTPVAIATALPGLPMQVEDVARVLKRLRARGYVAESDGEWRLTASCRQVLEDDSRRPLPPDSRAPRPPAWVRRLLARLRRRKREPEPEPGGSSE